MDAHDLSGRKVELMPVVNNLIDMLEQIDANDIINRDIESCRTLITPSSSVTESITPAAEALDDVTHAAHPVCCGFP